MVGSSCPEEKVTFSRQIAQRMTDCGRLSAAAKYQEHADDLDKEVSIIRKLILHGSGTKRNIAVDEEDKSSE
jgi:two-component system, chemotaxis family, protein-glutamate methylesterase/glutaminase